MTKKIKNNQATKLAEKKFKLEEGVYIALIQDFNRKNSKSLIIF